MKEDLNNQGIIKDRLMNWSLFKALSPVPLIKNCLNWGRFWRIIESKRSNEFPSKWIVWRRGNESIMKVPPYEEEDDDEGRKDGCIWLCEIIEVNLGRLINSIKLTFEKQS